MKPADRSSRWLCALAVVILTTWASALVVWWRANRSLAIIERLEHRRLWGRLSTDTAFEAFDSIARLEMAGAVLVGGIWVLALASRRWRRSTRFRITLPFAWLVLWSFLGPLWVWMTTTDFVICHLWAEGPPENWGWINSCGYIIDGDRARSWIAFAYAMGAALLMIPAGRAAWRSGLAGLSPPTWARRFAVGVFALGLGTYCATLQHEADWDATAEVCRDRPWETEGFTEGIYMDGTEHGELESVDAPQCRHEPTWFDDPVLVIGRLELSPDGTLADPPWYPLADVDTALDRLYVGEDELDKRLRGLADGALERRDSQRDSTHPEARDLPPPIMMLALHADRRTSSEVVRNVLGVAQRSGVDRILIVGTRTLERERADIGAWETSMLCPVAWFELDPQGRSVEAFDDWGELARAATEADGPLRVGAHSPSTHENADSSAARSIDASR